MSASDTATPNEMGRTINEARASLTAARRRARATPLKRGRSDPDPMTAMMEYGLAQMKAGLAAATREREQARATARAAAAWAKEKRRAAQLELAKTARVRAQQPPRPRSEAAQKRGHRCRICKGARRLPDFHLCGPCLRAVADRELAKHARKPARAPLANPSPPTRD